MGDRPGHAFQRASSAVEGRNGALSQLHHNQRGLPKRRYKVWTVLHNFDCRAPDGTTPAARFFRREFPDLFETVLSHIEALPQPRGRKRQGGAKSLKSWVSRFKRIPHDHETYRSASSLPWCREAAAMMVAAGHSWRMPWHLRMPRRVLRGGCIDRGTQMNTGQGCKCRQSRSPLDVLRGKPVHGWPRHLRSRRAQKVTITPIVVFMWPLVLCGLVAA